MNYLMTNNINGNKLCTFRLFTTSVETAKYVKNTTAEVSPSCYGPVP